MELKLYNTLTRKKEVFRPLDPANVRMYVCGPTVYDYAHIGNARPVIVFDVLFRLLRHVYGPEHLTYVRNITDVDDKIIAAAKEEGVSIDEITARTTKAFHEDVAALGCLEPSFEPRATEHIKAMIAMIEKLIATGHAYVAQGHVLYDVPSKPDYGKLAHRSTDEMIAGARVEVAPYKKHPMDFVLWKPSATDQPGWESPWGRGRPGWHIECSAMGEALLGETFDIHGGGIDLVFPHHENEIAQSESAHHGAPLAKFWMHNGFLEVEGAKMSKSLGNFVTIRDLVDEWPCGVVRLAMLQTHYRQPLNWTKDRLAETAAEVSEWYYGFESSDAAATTRCRLKSQVPVEPHPSILEALCDDLNTSDAVTAMRDLAMKKDRSGGAYEALVNSAEFLGLFNVNTFGAYDSTEGGWGVTAEVLIRVDPLLRKLRAAIANSRPSAVITNLRRSLAEQGVEVEIDSYGNLEVSARNLSAPDKIMSLIDARNAARIAKNFAEADRIRKELEEKGILLKDTPEGTTWELKR